MLILLIISYKLLAIVLVLLHIMCINTWSAKNSTKNCSCIYHNKAVYTSKFYGRCVDLCSKRAYSARVFFYLLYLLLYSCNGNDATPVTWSSASSTHGQAYHKTSCRSMRKAVTCMHEGERTSLWTSAKLKPALFRATSSLLRKTHYASRHFRCSYLKAK